MGTEGTRELPTQEQLQRWRQDIEAGHWPTRQGQLVLFDAIADRDELLGEVRARVELMLDMHSYDGAVGVARDILELMDAWNTTRD